jgi:phosphoglycerol transferase MdoB-like AlkP superfamily enzyme
MYILFFLFLLFYVFKIKKIFSIRYYKVIIIFIIFLWFIFINLDVKNIFTWDNYSFYIQNGFTRYLLNNIIASSRIKNIDDYSDKNIEIIFSKIFDDENYSKLNLKNRQYPNIILVLNETFWDITNLPYIKKILKKDILKFIHSNKVFYTNLYVPYFALGTANTEFEVLTGLSMKFFPFYVSPYVQYINNYVLSLPFILKEYNYHTWAIHPNFSWFYDRKNVYKFLGFDKFYSKEAISFNLKYREDGYPYDLEVYKEIINKMKISKQRDFVFFITIQNHFPYEFNIDDTYFKNDYIQRDSTLNKEIFNYLYLLKKTDDDIRTLYEEVIKLKEPTVVIIFGDHLPPFDKKTYNEIGIDNFFDKNLHLTPLIIFSNFPIPESLYQEIAKKEFILANHLMYYILKMVSIEHPYKNFIFKLIEDKLSKKEYDLVEYDILFGKRYFYQLLKEKFNIKLENPYYLIGEKQEIYNIYFTNLNHNFHVYYVEEKILHHIQFCFVIIKCSIRIL